MWKIFGGYLLGIFCAIGLDILFPGELRRIWPYGTGPVSIDVVYPDTADMREKVKVFSARIGRPIILPCTPKVEAEAGKGHATAWCGVFSAAGAGADYDPEAGTLRVNDGGYIRVMSEHELFAREEARKAEEAAPPPPAKKAAPKKPAAKK